MDKFVKDAFNDAYKADIEKECEAWSRVTINEKKASLTAAILTTGPKEMAGMIEKIVSPGLDTLLHSYEESLMMAGFSMGYSAGRESMLEETK